MFQLTDKAGRNMNATKGKILFAAIATAIAASASITRADDQPVVYGRAGIPVAEQRIQQLSQFQSRDSVRNENVVAWYGRAGYPVGAGQREVDGSGAQGVCRGPDPCPGRVRSCGYALPFGG